MDSWSCRNYSSGLNVISIEWGAWNITGGMANDSVLKNSESVGVGSLAAIDALNFFRMTISSKIIPPLVLVNPFDWKAFFRNHDKEKSTIFQDFFIYSKKCEHGTIKKNSSTEVLPAIEEEITRILRELPSKHASLVECGMDSVAAIEFSRALSKKMHFPLPVTLVYDYTSIIDIERYIVGMMNRNNIEVHKKSFKMHPKSDKSNILASWSQKTNRETSNDLITKTLKFGRVIPETPYSGHEIDKVSTIQPFGVIISNIFAFDSQAFHITEMECSYIDPQHRILLEVVQNARAQASMLLSQSGKDGVIVGISSNEFCQISTMVPKSLKATGGFLSVACGRISYVYNFTGPSMCIDTACSSSLVSLHLSNRTLTKLLIRIFSGGVNITLLQSTSSMFASAGMLSSDGRCKVLDALADGYVRSEECIIALLANFQEKDHIVIEVKGSAVSQDGRSSSLTAPNGPSQKDCINMAIADISEKVEVLEFFTFDLLQLHGTGTALGDPIEFGALHGLNNVTSKNEPLVVSASKSRSGHKEPASGLFGLVNAIEQCKNSTIQAMFHLTFLSRHIAPYLCTGGNIEEGKAWCIHRQKCSNLSSKANKNMNAGTSAFAFQGTNSHIITSTFENSAREVRISILRGLLSRIDYNISLKYYCVIKTNAILLHCDKVLATFCQNSVSQQYLHDHRIQGKAVFPAAAFLEIISSCSQYICDENKMHQDIVMVAAAILSRHNILNFTCTISRIAGIFQAYTKSQITIQSSISILYSCSFNKERETPTSTTNQSLFRPRECSKIYCQDYTSSEAYGIVSNIIYSNLGDYTILPISPAMIDSSFHLASEQFNDNDIFLPISIRYFLAEKKDQESLKVQTSNKHQIIDKKQRLNNYKMWQEKAMVSIYQLILKKIGHNLNTNKMVVSSVVESKRKFTPKMMYGELSCADNQFRILSAHIGKHIASQRDAQSPTRSLASPLSLFHNCKKICMGVEVFNQGSMNVEQKIDFTRIRNEIFVKTAISELPEIKYFIQIETHAAQRNSKLDLDSQFQNDSTYIYGNVRYSTFLMSLKYKGYLSSNSKNIDICITGGIGAIAKLLLTEDANIQVRKSTLLSRKARTSLNFVQMTKLFANRSIHLVKCNICKVEDLTFEVDIFLKKNIIHAAGKLYDGLLNRQNCASLRVTNAPKIDSMMHLVSFIRLFPLSIITMSSISSLLVSPGQLNYAASNKYMNSWVYKINVQGIVGLSIKFGAWNGIEGMATKSTISRLEKGGVGYLSANEGLTGIQICLLHIQCINVTELVLNRFKMKRDTETRPLTSDTFCIKDIEIEIASLIQAIIGDVQKSLEINEPFMDSGLDSLGLLELRQSVMQHFDIDLPSTVSFDYPTVGELSKYILSLMSPKNCVNTEIDTIRAKQEKKDEKFTFSSLILFVGVLLPGFVSEIESFWNVLMSGIENIESIPQRRFDRELCGADGRFAAFLPQISYFDSILFRYSFQESREMDPQQRILLESCLKYFTSSRKTVGYFQGYQIGIYLGVMWTEYQHLLRFINPDRKSIYLGTGNGLSFLLGRPSFVFGLNGPSCITDTACSSSLVALHLSQHALMSAECIEAFVGGIQCMILAETFMIMNNLKALSSDSRCKTLDVSANGYGRGEGTTLLYLGSYDEESLKWHIIRIRGSSVNQDGRSSSFTSPYGPSQQNLIKDALKKSNLNYVAGLISLHGTGTSLGDPIEVSALKEVCHKDSSQYLTFASSKSFFGHTEGAAGLTGLILACASIFHSACPEMRFCRNLNPHVTTTFTNKSHFSVINRCVSGILASTKVTGTSSFGMSGINSHSILDKFSRTLLSKRKEHLLHYRSKFWPVNLVLLSIHTMNIITSPGELNFDIFLEVLRHTHWFEHIISGKLILPGATYLEIGVSSINQLNLYDDYSSMQMTVMRNTAFQRPLLLKQNTQILKLNICVITGGLKYLIRRDMNFKSVVTSGTSKSRVLKSSKYFEKTTRKKRVQNFFIYREHIIQYLYSGTEFWLFQLQYSMLGCFYTSWIVWAECAYTEH